MSRSTENRVNYLFRFLEQHGFPVDNANKNPSRLSRMPGVTRNGVTQELLATHIGKHMERVAGVR